MYPAGLPADAQAVYWVALGTAAASYTDGALYRATQ